MPAARPASARWRRRGLSALLLLCGLASWSLPPAHAQPVAARVAAVRATEHGERWSELKPAQREALRPLEHEWPGLDAQSKQKWLQLSARFPKLKPDERARVQARMADWAKLTPRQRGEARLNFQEAKQLPAPDREARWKAYEALSPEQKARLAVKASREAESRRSRTPRRASPLAKSNIVPNPAYAAPPRAITPTVVQARPGATTTPITRRPVPPRHQQTGLPKIAASPGFVNKSTLLPQRGPQGAATRAAPPSAPEARRR
jgi:hypothetical protein